MITAQMNPIVLLYFNYHTIAKTNDPLHMYALFSDVQATLNLNVS